MSKRIDFKCEAAGEYEDNPMSNGNDDASPMDTKEDLSTLSTECEMLVEIRNNLKSSITKSAVGTDNLQPNPDPGTTTSNGASTTTRTRSLISLATKTNGNGTPQNFGGASSSSFSSLPTPGVTYMIDSAALQILLQIKPRISDAILNSGAFLCWKLLPDDEDDEDFQRTQRYFDNSKNAPNCKIKSILRIMRTSDMEPHALDAGPKMMLFHQGTEEKHIGDILNTGFMPSIGKGIIFADRVPGNKNGGSGGWLLLSEVLLGKVFQTKYSWTPETSLLDGFDSVKRVGQSCPDPIENEKTEDDCIWPLGKTIKSPGDASSPVPRNEYIIFCKRQAKPKYLIQYEEEIPPRPSKPKPTQVQLPPPVIPPRLAVAVQAPPCPEIDDEFSYLPSPGVDYLIEDTSLLTLFQIRPRISDTILTSGTFLTWKAGPGDDDFKRIQKYFDNSRLPHRVQIKNVLRIVRMSDVEPHPLEEGGPKMMLFHGTKEANIGEILHTGFLPAMSRYGGGIFFADRVAKSLSYCSVTKTNKDGGYLFLCEVLLGKICHSNDWSTTLPAGCNSIKRDGRCYPDESENETEDDGCVWPVGKTLKVGVGMEGNRTFPHNEYIVFCKRQARPKYLIEYEKIPLRWTTVAELKTVQKATK